MSPIIRILMERDGMSRQDARDMLEAARERVARGADPEEVLLADFGIEPDYIFDLID